MKRTAIPSLLLSAILLFYVQPFAGRLVLPYFGSSASVWTTCLAFFQLVLLLGYLYAHGLRRLKPSLQGRLHFFLTAACLAATLRLADVTAFRAAAQTAGLSPAPVWSLLGLLALWIGPATFAVATNSPLMQAWIGEKNTHDRRVYRLYALSNIGSFVGLFAYPLLVEPWLPTSQQAGLFAALFALYALLTLAASAMRFRSHTTSTPTPQRIAERFSTDSLLVLAASVASTLLLMGMTQHLTVDIPPVPLMWAVLLGLYLLSFVIGFSGRATAAMPALLALSALLLLVESRLFVLEAAQGTPAALFRMASGALALFVTCTAMATWQYSLRPQESGLTRYYLMMAIGGAIGGLLGSIIAPLVFHEALEYPVALVGATVMIAAHTYINRSHLHPASRMAYVLPAVATVFLLSGTHNAALETIWKGRSFYSILAIRDEMSVSPDGRKHHIRHFYHGNTVHGRELVSGRASPPEPLAYYARISGIGRYIEARNAAHPGSQKVGLIGLGVGALAAYGRSGDTYTFYEIDPLVLSVASNPDWFGFLSESPATIEQVVGDARIQLARERDSGARAYDLIVADAFSSDAIPMHLLTLEAFELYRAHLADGGVIAVHISNRYFDFKPLMKAMAEALGLTLTLYQSDTAGLCLAADWAFLSDAPLVFAPHAHGRVIDSTPIPPARLWTDDFHSLLRLAK